MYPFGWSLLAGIAGSQDQNWSLQMFVRMRECISEVVCESNHRTSWVCVFERCTIKIIDFSLSGFFFHECPDLELSV